MTVADPAESGSGDPETGHQPVMCREILEGLEPCPGEVLLDATAGRGGHAALLAPLLAPGGRYIGFDLDPDNCLFVRRRLESVAVRCDLVRGNFARGRVLLDGLGVGRVNLLLADLGVASVHLDQAWRGFSFRQDGPLDMRLDPQLPVSAADLIARLGEKDLADLIYRYGEERLSRRIARNIVEARRQSPINNTRRLAELCARAYGGAAGRWKIDPATRTFQALRIAVNDEMGNLEALLARLPDLLAPGARVAFISFHSLEDRQVKLAFRDFQKKGWLEPLHKKPLEARPEERSHNPRSRSAKLRMARWIGDSGMHGGEKIT